MRSYVIVLTYCSILIISAPVSFSATSITLDLLSDANSEWTVSRLTYRFNAEQFDQNSPCDMEGTVSNSENDGYWSSCQSPLGTIQPKLENFEDFVPKFMSIWSYTRGDAQINISISLTPDEPKICIKSIEGSNAWQEDPIPLGAYDLTHESVITIESSADPNTYPTSIDLIDKIYLELEPRVSTTTDASTTNEVTTLEPTSDGTSTTDDITISSTNSEFTTSSTESATISTETSTILTSTPDRFSSASTSSEKSPSSETTSATATISDEPNFSSTQTSSTSISSLNGSTDEELVLILIILTSVIFLALSSFLFVLLFRRKMARVEEEGEKEIYSSNNSQVENYSSIKPPPSTSNYLWSPSVYAMNPEVEGFNNNSYSTEIMAVSKPPNSGVVLPPPPASPPTLYTRRNYDGIVPSKNYNSSPSAPEYSGIRTPESTYFPRLAKTQQPPPSLYIKN